MPATFSHPLAVVPLYRLFPRQLNFAALIIGSISPDFAYFAHQFSLAGFAHTTLGTFVICLPTGFVALAIFYALRRPLCFLLPQPHRRALTPLASLELRPSLRSLLSAVLSLLLGAWTHTIWDSFTHAGAWSVRQFPILSSPAIEIGDTVLPVSYVLQQLSTFGGVIALIFMYLLWLRHQRTSESVVRDSFSDLRRYLVLSLIVVVSIGLGMPPALQMAANFEGFTAIRVLVFRTTVYSIAVFAPLFVIVAMILDAAFRRKDA